MRAFNWRLLHLNPAHDTGVGQRSGARPIEPDPSGDRAGHSPG